MCGRYVLVQNVEVLEKRFNVTMPLHFDWKPSYNISPGKLAPVITSENPREIQLFTFGLTPFWSKKKMYLFNARVEGDKNKEDDPNYKGSKDIIIKPAFRKPIRSQRCLIPADAFIEGTSMDGLSKPYLVYLKNKERPFSFAGIYDVWIDPITGEEHKSFSIITTVANSLLQKIPHHRSPVILPKSLEGRWLNNNIHLTDVTSMLVPYAAENMNAFPISPDIKNPKNDDRNLIAQIGEKLDSEVTIRTTKELRLEGMGSRKKLNEQDWDSKNSSK